MKKKGKLILEDGTVFEGFIFGADRCVSGEVVFNTAMTGYTESLSDPSYAGQILVSTYPIVGNYGVPSSKQSSDIDGVTEYWESETFHPIGFIVHDYTDGYAHWNATESLETALGRCGVVGLYGIDTRELTKIIRDKGPILGKIIPDGCEEIDFFSYDEVNLVDTVSTKEIRYFDTGKKDAKHVVLVDCGVKQNIIRLLLKLGVRVTMVPWNYDITTLDYDGLFISNGPGNPNHCTTLVENVRRVLAEGKKPIAGICMGNQILALAIGAEVKKMKFGHRSVNQPVRLCGTNRCYLTSQNHGFAVDDTNLPEGWTTYFTNLNDGTNEGLRHTSGKYFSVQFHPENNGGPMDTEFIFDDFLQLLLNDSTSK